MALCTNAVAHGVVIGVADIPEAVFGKDILGRAVHRDAASPRVERALESSSADAMYKVVRIPWEPPSRRSG